MPDRKKWTVMVYLAGDNNLSDEMIWALKEMYRVGTGGTCNIAVQFDPVAPGLGPRRYDIGELEQKADIRGDVDGIIELDFLKKFLVQSPDGRVNPENTSDPCVLGGFLKWVFEENSQKMDAEHYALILSGHGSGATGGFLQESDPGGGITIASFARVLKAATKFRRKIDILGLDCCSMSMAELGHEVQEVVRYLVGAEGFTENAGWPYHRLLECLRKEPSPRDLATQIVDRYFFYYSDYLASEVSADQSAVDVGNKLWCDHLIRQFAKLSGMLRTALDNGNEVVRKALILAHWEAQSYDLEQNVDLYDFCSRLERNLKGTRESAIRNICATLTNKAKWKKIVPLSLYSGPMYQHSHGLSLYFPWSEVAVDYGKLKFAIETEWDKFLKKYIERTCREIRDDDRQLKKRVKPRTLEALSDGCFVNADGLPIYRSSGLESVPDDSFNSICGSGLNSVRGGGLNSARGGGLNSARGGGLNSARGGGLNSARGGGLNSARGGGLNSARGGGLNSARGGGLNSARGGGLNSARLITHLSSMKNFPAGFFQPQYKSLSDVRALRTRGISLNADSLTYQIADSGDPVLQRVFTRLDDKKKKAILKFLKRRLKKPRKELSKRATRSGS